MLIEISSMKENIIYTSTQRSLMERLEWVFKNNLQIVQDHKKYHRSLGKKSHLLSLSNQSMQCAAFEKFTTCPELTCHEKVLEKINSCQLHINAFQDFSWYFSRLLACDILPIGKDTDIVHTQIIPF
ncbi:hypothetical protein KIL84_013139 [Mauremys mutica]|uniref:Uncharacterized protein n=1 Tax=Mauremys mutica TaxID=74926 RepID=A0A9D3WQL4_9SAUR|nr:hypothetical protein KIL84_013139 [Mauremys mutica]